MRQAVADTNADPFHLAYLEDRLRTGRGLPQLYGTQFSSTAANTEQTWMLPVADIKNVNHRRAEMQMTPLEQYVEAFAASYSEQGMLDSDTPVIDMGDDYVRFYYLGDQFSIQPTEKQQGVTDAVEYMQQGDYKDFFALLWREVERGNLHAEDYASLYDHTHYRLHHHQQRN